MKASPTRLRWFTLRPFDQKALRKLSDGMLAAKFAEETGFGFVLGDVRKDKFTGRFIKRETVTRSITDPQGEVQNIQFTDFSTIRFTFTTDSPNLELVNPPRRLLEFITTVGDLLDNKIAILPIETTCRQWLEALAASSCTVHPKKLAIGSIAISDTVTMKATFSGTRHVQKEAATFLKGRRCDPVEIAGDLECEGSSARFKLSSNGGFTLMSAPSDALLAAVRRACATIATART